MSGFRVGTRRLDPYRNFRFRVLSGASRTPVAGFSKTTSLEGRAARVATVRGARRRLSPEPVTLDRGITHDRRFISWVSRRAAKGASPPHLPRDLRIAVRSAAGRPPRHYALSRCRMVGSAKRLTPEPDTHGVRIDRLRLHHEGYREVSPGRQRI
jgi:hypothetical protein